MPQAFRPASRGVWSLFGAVFAGRFLHDWSLALAAVPVVFLTVMASRPPVK